MRKNQIEKITSNLLQEIKSLKPPVQVEEIAQNLGLKILPYDLGEKVSGVLVIKNGKATIGYNRTESFVRRRFTIAHELGHYFLHRTTRDLFIDKQFKVLFRDESSSSGEIKQEQEANAFAAALLMPEELLKEEIKKLDLDLADEDAIKKLATAFKVSTIAMTFRISNLKIF